MTRDDELLASFVAGELGADDPELRELLARDPERASQLAELIALRARLDRDGQAEREAIDEARSEVSDIDRARVGRAMRTGAGLHPWRRAAAFIAAAAAVIATLFLLRPEESDEGRGGKQVHILNKAAAIELHAPDGVLAPGVELSWSEAGREVASSDRWQLEFRHVDSNDKPGKLVTEWITCRAAHWTPSAADLAGWPDRVSWSVHRVDASDASSILVSSDERVLPVSR